MSKLFVAINVRSGLWYSDRSSAMHRPKFYRTLKALFDSVCKNGLIFPKRIDNIARAKIGSEYSPNTFVYKQIYKSECKKYIRENKLSYKDLLLMLQEEGFLDIREVSEDEILNLLFQNEQYKLK